jgi:hypothetical protein
LVLQVRGADANSRPSARLTPRSIRAAKSAGTHLKVLNQGERTRRRDFALAMYSIVCEAVAAWQAATIKEWRQAKKQ